ncbi:hypothetical protein, partial [Acidiphilium sp. 34-64-41]|uniref:hypothetical protein n=1 Tax=Acidiphilium sp. 34-64-41 TaxID=1970297 RepID=UPI002579F171
MSAKLPACLLLELAESGHKLADAAAQRESRGALASPQLVHRSPGNALKHLPANRTLPTHLLVK